MNRKPFEWSGEPKNGWISLKFGIIVLLVNVLGFSINFFKILIFRAGSLGSSTKMDRKPFVWSGEPKNGWISLKFGLIVILLHLLGFSIDFFNFGLGDWVPVLNWTIKTLCVARKTQEWLDLHEIWYNCSFSECIGVFN